MAKVQLKETDDLLDIRYDAVFKAVFTRDIPASKMALSRLVSAYIGRNVSVININANEQPIENLADRRIRFDINCRAENGELINVEMSLNPDSFEPVRLEFYAGKLFTAQDIHGIGKDYSDLKEAYQITLLAKERFFPDDFFLHAFEYYDPKLKVSLNGRSRIITVELSKLGQVIEKPTAELSVQEYWAIFFQYLTDKGIRRKINEIMEQEEGIAMASEVLLTVSKDEAERARLMSEYKYQLDTQSKLVHAEREGLKRGKQEIIDLLKSGKSPEEIIKEYNRDS